ncbi:MAG TPA: hypothetical protein VGM10_17390 [Actinocrinis sp.]
MRPVLKPALALIHHPDLTLQLGLGPATSHRYRLTAGTRALVDALDGTRDIDGLLAYAERIGVGRGEALELLDLLAADGCLDDEALDTSALAALSPAERGRLGPDLSSLGLRNRLPGGAVRALERRRARTVAVHGLGRVGSQAALRLAAAGLGAVIPLDQLPVAAADTGPGGFDDADTGSRRQEAAARHIRRCAPSAGTALPPHRARPDLAVVALGGLAAAPLLADLAEQGVAHLPVEVREDRAVLGPLVLPGATACTRCLDLARTDRDPHWPWIAARSGGHPGLRPACDSTLAALASAQAVLHVLAFLDGLLPPSVSAVIEYPLPYGLPERVRIEPHPACGCLRPPSAP